MKKLLKARGWHSPSGSFHKVLQGDHNDWANHRVNNMINSGELSQEKADEMGTSSMGVYYASSVLHKLGWVRTVMGHDLSVEDMSHPKQNKTLRNIIEESPNDKDLSIHDEQGRSLNGRKEELLSHLESPMGMRKSFYSLRTNIKKGMIQTDPNERSKMMHLHGWISPTGQFVQANPDETHFDTAKRFESNNPGSKVSHENEWLQIGTGGSPSVLGVNKVLSNPNHPAMKEFINRVKQAHASINNFDVYNLDTDNEPYKLPRTSIEAGNLAKPTMQENVTKSINAIELTNAKQLITKLLNHPKIEFLNISAQIWAKEQNKKLNNQDPYKTDVNYIQYVENKARLLINECEKWKRDQDTNSILQTRGAYLDEIPINKIVYLKDERNQIREKRLQYQIDNFDESPPIIVHLIDLNKEEGNWIYPKDFDPSQGFYYLENGHHRLIAAIKLGKEMINAIICPIDKGSISPSNNIDKEDNSPKIKTGLISPSGEFHECQSYNHDILAVKLANKLYNMRFYNYSGNDDALMFLYNNGWLAIGLNGEINVAGNNEYLKNPESLSTITAINMFEAQLITDPIDVIIADKEIVESIQSSNIENGFTKASINIENVLNKTVLVLKSNRLLKVIDYNKSSIEVAKRGDITNPSLLVNVDKNVKMSTKSLINIIKSELSKSHPFPVSPKLLGKEGIPYRHGKRAEENVGEIDKTNRHIVARKIVNILPKNKKGDKKNISAMNLVLDKMETGRTGGANFSISEDPSKWIAFKKKGANEDVKKHEAFHGYMNDIESKYGLKGRLKYIDHLHSHIHPEDSKYLEQALRTVGYSDKHINEEIIAHGIDLMHNSKMRTNLIEFAKHKDGNFDIDRFKSSYRKMQQAAAKITPEFFNENVKKSINDEDIEYILKAKGMYK